MDSVIQKGAIFDTARALEIWKFQVNIDHPPVSSHGSGDFA
jgi:hypothetical protein